MPSRSRKKRSEDKSRWTENRDGGLQRMKMYYESNKESTLSASRALNSELFREKSGVRYADNPEPKKEASKRNYNQNPEPKTTASKRAYDANPQPKEEASKQNSKRKYDENPQPKKEAAKKNSYSENPIRKSFKKALQK